MVPEGETLGHGGQGPLAGDHHDHGQVHRDQQPQGEENAGHHAPDHGLGHILIHVDDDPGDGSEGGGRGEPTARQPRQKEARGLVEGDVAQVALQHVQGGLRQQGLELIHQADNVDVHHAQNVGHADEHREHSEQHEVGQAGGGLGHPAAEIEHDGLPQEEDKGGSPELFQGGHLLFGGGQVLNLDRGT